jgi:hypothetical protein
MKPNTKVNIEKLESALQSLREANGRLKLQVKALDTALERLHHTMYQVYEKHGSPFGPSLEATRIWHKYLQFTTPN